MPTVRAHDPRLGPGAAADRARRRSSRQRSSRRSPNGSPAASPASRPRTSSACASSGVLDFAVTPAVLIPRPETEFIVEEALEILTASRSTHRKVADIGTGSGNIAVSLAHELPTRQYHGHRRLAPRRWPSRPATRERYGVDDRIDFVETSYLDGVDDTFDLIAANPPYVKDGDKPALARDVRHEPDVALFGGTSGLA